MSAREYYHHPRSEVDSLIPPAPHRHKKACPCANTDKPKG